MMVYLKVQGSYKKGLGRSEGGHEGEGSQRKDLLLNSKIATPLNPKPCSL